MCTKYKDQHNKDEQDKEAPKERYIYIQKNNK